MLGGREGDFESTECTTNDTVFTFKFPIKCLFTHSVKLKFRWALQEMQA